MYDIPYLLSCHLYLYGGGTICFCLFFNKSTDWSPSSVLCLTFCFIINPVLITRQNWQIQQSPHIYNKMLLFLHSCPLLGSFNTQKHQNQKIKLSNCTYILCQVCIIMFSLQMTFVTFFSQWHLQFPYFLGHDLIYTSSKKCCFELNETSKKPQQFQLHILCNAAQNKHP